MNKIKNILVAITPHGLVCARSRRKFHAERRRRILLAAQNAGKAVRICGDDHEKVVEFLVARGIPEEHVRTGSIPLSSLQFLSERVIKHLPSDGPPRALHVGNFVGVSLAFLAQMMVKRNPESLVVSIDPNLCHRGVSNPQQHVAALLSACGLQKNVMILAGYSGRKSISNDGAIFGDYDPQHQFLSESACEESIQNLQRICPRSFDIVMMDGNHEAEYLAAEIKSVLPLIKPGGFLALDDVDESWAEIRDVFMRLGSIGLKVIDTDGRVGIAQLPTK